MPLRLERDAPEVDAVGDADCRPAEDFGVVGEGHDAVHPAGSSSMNVSTVSGVLRSSI